MLYVALLIRAIRGLITGQYLQCDEKLSLKDIEFTVARNDYFMIFVPKMSYFTLEEVGNPVQILKNDELSRFQAIMQKPGTFVESLFT